MTAETAGWIGWAATSMTVSSYFFHNQITLRRVQAVAALLWITYGVAISARPVIAANVIVTTVAFWSTYRESRRLAREAESAHSHSHNLESHEPGRQNPS